MSNDDLDPRQTPAFCTKQLAHELNRLAEADLRPLGIGVGGLRVLTAVKTGEASTQAELVRLLQVEQPSMAQMLSRLERDGLITRLPELSNKRIQRISLTPMSHEILRKSKNVLMRGNDLALSDFTDAEKELILELLKRMQVNLSTKNR